MKKIISILTVLAIILTIIAIAIPTAVAAIEPPAGQDVTLGTTVVCSSSPTTTLSFSTNAQRRSVDSISKLTDNESMRALGYKTYNGFGSSMNNTHVVAAFDFPSGAVTDANGGYIFYLDLPVFNSYADVNVPIEHVIALQRHTVTGAVAAYTQRLGGKNDTISWYTLPDGESEWQECNEWVSFNESPYGLKISDGTKPFRGYVYVPTPLIQKNGYVDTSGLELGGISIVVDVDRKTYGGSGDGRGSERGVAPIDVSAITLVSSFKKDSTLAYNDYGQLIDLVTEDAIEDTNTASMTWFQDEFGNKTNIYHTNESLPSSVTLSKNLGVTKNTSVGLPVTTLFDFTVGSENHTVLNWQAEKGGKGVMFYVEMPKSANGGDVRFSTQFYITDGQSGEKNAVRYQYGYQNWYFLAEGESDWTSKTISYYGVPVPSGFKGYIYIPFKTVTTGASDLIDTPEDEHRPQECDTDGNYIFKDNITGERTTSATDAEGNPNTPIYTYQPTNTNPHYKNAGIDDEDTLTGFIIQTGGNYMVTNGNMAENDKIVMSQPVIIKGEVADTATPNTRTLKISGNDEYLFNSYVPYTGDAAYTALRTPVGKRSVTTYDENAVMTKIPAISPLVAGAYEFTNLSTNRTFQSEMSQIDSSLATGVIFYVETTLENFEVNINTLVYNTAGEKKYPQTSPLYGTIYYLKEGDATWQQTGDKASSGASANYRRKIKTTGTFKGYIYQPFGGDAAYPSIDQAYFKYAGITFWPTTADGSWTDASGAAATLKISDPILVTSLNTATNMVVLDGGALLDPITGECLKGSFLDADTFMGDAEALKIVGDVMSLKPMTDPARNDKHNVTDSGTFSTYTANGYTGAIAENDTIFGDDLLRVTGSSTATQSGADMVQMYYTKTLFDDVDGYAIYFKNNSETPLRFAVQPYTAKVGGGTDWTQVSAALPFLSYNGGNWKWITKTVLSGYTYELAAGESGFLYLSNASIFNGEYTYYLKIRTSSTASYPTTNVDFTMSAPYAVNGFTDNAPGMAYVNGAAVPQELYTGEFTVPNDFDGNLNINLLDLARGRAKDADIQTLRDTYLSLYFEDIVIEEPEEEEIEKDYTPISLNKPLTALTASDYKLLSDNPDRGYRTEMVVSLQEKYDEGETRDPRNLYTSGTEAEIREAMNQIFEIYLPTNAEHHSKLVLAFVSFKDWNKSEYLPQEVLDVLEIYFEYCRKYEIRVLLRFSYGVPTNLYIANEADREKLEQVCADEETMIRHIKQLSPFVAKHRDVVHKISSGWIGNGEMVASFQWPAVNFDNIIRAVVEEMCVPNDLYFTVRLPRYEVDMLNNYKAAYGKDYPYANVIGFNNDAIFGEQNHTDHHSGCYQYNHVNCGKNCWKNGANYFDEWQYAIKNAAFTPQCGEMFTNQNIYETNRVPTGLEVMLEMAHHRYTGFSQWHGYLDTSGYKEDNSNVFSTWINNENYSAADLESFGIIYDPNSFVDSEGNAVTQNPYQYLRDHLGYKLVAENTTFEWSGKSGEFADVSLSFKNYGFAAPFTLTSGFALLDENYNVVTKLDAGDPDKWYSLDPDYYTDDYNKSGSVQDDVLTYNLESKLRIPSKEGKYYVAFYLQNELGEGARLSNDIVFEKEFNILHEITVE